jgi:hypothetical protein
MFIVLLSLAKPRFCKTTRYISVLKTRWSQAKSSDQKPLLHFGLKNLALDLVVFYTRNQNINSVRPGKSQ